MKRGVTTVAVVAALALGAALAWLLSREEPRPLRDGAPRRVIAFAPNLNEAAYVLGHGDRVIAVTDYCVWPPVFLDRPRIGGMIDPNLERIAALAPDLLVVQGEAAALREFCVSQGFRLAEVKMDDEVATILAGFVELNRILGGRPERGLAVADSIRRELDAIAQANAGGERPRVVLSLGHEPDSLDGLYTVGGGTFLSELVEIAGGVNAFEDHRAGYFLLSMETLLSAAPSIAIELRPGESVSGERRGELEALWAHALADAPHVGVVEFDGAMIPGPRIAETARAFSAIIDARE